MREIVMDTETTGFEPSEGHKLVEIGAIELWNHLPTGKVYHQYINPQRMMPKEAFEVHGLGDDFLRDKPLFSHVAQAFWDFIGDAPLVIHNAAFDMKFLNAELMPLGFPRLPDSRAIDTVMMARKKFPGSPASLDALCRRFGIDNSKREKHGALLDSELLAEVYLELIGGRQPDLAMVPEPAAKSKPGAVQSGTWRPGARPAPLASRITDEEAAAHADFVAKLGEAAIWLKRQ
ncbi:DNA polymerase III subunit epsilon [Neogemmobacter tilapiae]|uniref:DNA polymerase III subunit epsilon n=1 Tax=Neogemmobacter tilapiae TaxID=875041 RepID=A0A918TJD2_9RHOB|nr:DNA polymerase III subunit epsilon [Gemmobacter tilapiae]GHC51747.1 DNA polymerase III subunit epsilon [Gemmobacter tilapiae]